MLTILSKTINPSLFFHTDTIEFIYMYYRYSVHPELVSVCTKSITGVVGISTRSPRLSALVVLFNGKYRKKSKKGPYSIIGPIQFKARGARDLKK